MNPDEWTQGNQIPDKTKLGKEGRIASFLSDVSSKSGRSTAGSVSFGVPTFHYVAYICEICPKDHNIYFPFEIDVWNKDHEPMCPRHNIVLTPAPKYSSGCIELLDLNKKAKVD